MQAIGATTPAFTAALALLMLAKKESLATYSALVPVVAGIVLATGFEPSYNAVGFSAAMAATAARAVKAIIQVLACSTVYLQPRPRDWAELVMFVACSSADDLGCERGKRLMCSLCAATPAES